MSETIARHRAFPAIVAGWFGALFGFGTLVLPVGVFESLMTGTGIASLIPAAAPPLGMSARVVIALIAAAIGVALGLFLARRVVAQMDDAAADETTPEDTDAAFPTVKKPISAREELGSETLDDPVDTPAFLNAEVVEEPTAELTPELAEFVQSDADMSDADLASFPDLDTDMGEAWPLVAEDVLAESGDSEEWAEFDSDDVVVADDEPRPASDLTSKDVQTPPAADAEPAELTLAQLIDRFATCLEARHDARVAEDDRITAPQPEFVEDARPSLGVALGEPLFDADDEEGDTMLADAGFSSLLTMNEATARPVRANSELPETAPAKQEIATNADPLHEALERLELLRKTG